MTSPWTPPDPACISNSSATGAARAPGLYAHFFRRTGDNSLGDFGHDGAGGARQLSVQADCALSSYAALTYYPFGQHTLRLIGETAQQRESRSSTLYALVQF